MNKISFPASLALLCLLIAVVVGVQLWTATIMPAWLWFPFAILIMVPASFAAHWLGSNSR